MVIVDCLFHSVRPVEKKGSFIFDRSVRAKQRKKLLPVHQSLGGDCMKKIIAISVMFVLIAGAAFADTSFGGNMRITANLASKAPNQDDPQAGDVHVYDSNMSANWSGDNAGGMMRFHANGKGGTSLIDWAPDFFGFVWWKPIDQFRLQIGKNADGDWGHNQITGWGYNAEAQNGAAVDQHRGIGANAQVARTSAWWGGFGDLGITLTLFLAQGFEVDIGVPMYEAGDLAVVYSNTKINFKVDVPDIGTVRLAASLNKVAKDGQGNSHLKNDTSYTPPKTADADLLANIHFAFYLSAIENIGLEVGFGFFQDSKDDNHMEFGLGFRTTADDFGLKARVGFVMKDKDKGGSQLGIGVLPSYNLGSFKFFFNAGFGMNLDKDSDAAGKQDWFVNPYIQVPTSAGSFYAGIKLIDVGAKGASEGMSWALPIQWNVYY
jgi:hypothetical protein